MVTSICLSSIQIFLVNLNEVAGSGTGATEKRPDSMKLFERKKHDIQLKSDDFRNCCQTSPILRPGFF